MNQPSRTFIDPVFGASQDIPEPLPRISDCAAELVFAGDAIDGAFSAGSEEQHAAMVHMRRAIAKTLKIMPQIKTKGRY